MKDYLVWALELFISMKIHKLTYTYTCIELELQHEHEDRNICYAAPPAARVYVRAVYVGLIES